MGLASFVGDLTLADVEVWFIGIFAALAFLAFIVLFFRAMLLTLRS